jgi:hypothetical protein
MIRHRISIVAFMIIALAATPSWSGPSDISGVEPMKALVGEWEGTGPQREPVRVLSTQLRDSILVETFLHATALKPLKLGRIRHFSRKEMSQAQ